MNLPEMIVALVALVVIGGILRARRAGPSHPSTAEPIDDDTRRLAHEVQQLKARIQVLERVITDNARGSDLEREIDGLRDR